MISNHNLEVFIQVVETQSITKTAKILFVSQPAISNIIRKLEEELNIQLFYRDKRKGLLLTDVGKRIYNIAKQIEDLDNKIHQIANEENHLISGRLRIASLPSLTSTLVSKSLKRFHVLYPDVIIEIKEGTPNDIFKMVENREVDFAISCSPFGNFDHDVLIHDHIIAMLPLKKKVPKKINLMEPLDTLIINHSAYETIIDHISQNNFLNTNQIIRVQNAETAVNMVLEGIGIGIISEYTLENLLHDYQKCSISPTISFDIGIFANDLGDLTIVANEFINIIKKQLY